MQKVLEQTISIKKLYLYLLLGGVWSFLFFYRKEITNFAVYNWMLLPYESNFSKSIWFFLEVVQRIFLLLALIIFLSGIIRSYFTKEKTRKKLEGKSLLTGNILASILGIVTPFCSCSAIPLFIGFIEAGIPVGITFSFLIASPLINEVAVVMLFSLFGWQTGVIYILAGLIIAVFSGWMITKFHLEKWIQDWVYDHKGQSAFQNKANPTFEDRINAGERAVKQILSKIWIYVLIGIAVGAFIHGYVPEDALASLMQKSGFFSVPLAVLIGVPLYSCSAGAAPIAAVLIEKGVPLGTALAFMMAVIGISLPELIILRKVLKIQLLLLFAGILSVGIILVGYIFNGIF